MIEDCLEVFEKKLLKEGEEIILDNYTLSEGSYVIVDKKGGYKISFEVDKNSDCKEHKDYKYFVIRDYLSKLIEMNKPVDSSKQIHSNNYCTYFIKKKSVKKATNKKEFIEDIPVDITEKYFEVFKNPSKKYKDKKNKNMLYLEIENKIGTADTKNIDSNCSWIKDNLKKVLKEVKKSDDYLKIFFEEDIEVFQNESEKYIVPHIYNDNKYNVNIDDKLYGVPNYNMGFNSKKPYLDCKTRKLKYPLVINSEKSILQKKFFDYLYNFACQNKNNVYFDNDNFYAVGDNEDFFSKHDNFSGWYLRIKKGKEVEIHDQDIVNFSNKKFDFPVENILNIDYSGKESVLEYKKKCTLNQVSSFISEIFFNKFLRNNYYTDIKDIKLNDSKAKEYLVLSRKAFFNWFYKGDNSTIKPIINSLTLDLIKNSIKKNYYLKACEQFNLRNALLRYFKIGGFTMGDIIDVSNSLREKINKDEMQEISGDKEYFFAIGQLVNYLYSQNKAAKQVQSSINPIADSKTNKGILNIIRKLHKKYGYSINKPNKRFDNMYTMIIDYSSNAGKIDENMIIGGYLFKNLIYDKKEK